MEKSDRTVWRILRYIITVLHFAATFLWGNRVFENIGVNPAGSFPLSDFISDRFEQVMAFVITELFAFIFIAFIWKLIFHIFLHFRPSFLFFILLFAAGTVVLASVWPYVWSTSEDNYITYASAVRLTPDYWHCAYSSFVYGASMLVFPVDFMILLIQWGFFVFAVAYLYYRIDRVAGRFKYVSLIFFLFPSAFRVMRDSYRIYQYLIAALIFATIVLFDLMEKKERSLPAQLGLAAFGAFLAVWRSEGIIWASALFLIYLVFGPRRSPKKVWGMIFAYLVLFVMILAPQKIGMIKYYGNDYQIVNSMNRLRTMFNAPDLDLEYEGAAEDVAAIDAVVPHEYIKEYGLIAYLSCNSGIRGSRDINQSGVSAQVSKEYSRGYYGIILHNLDVYARLSVDVVTRAYLAREIYYKPYEFEYEHHDLPQWSFEAWDIGKQELLDNHHTAKWKEVTDRLGYGPKLIEGWNRYEDWVDSHRVRFWVFALLCTLLLLFFLGGIISFAGRGDYVKLSFGLFAAALLAEFAALILVMPAYADVYTLITTDLSILLVIAVISGRFYRKRALD